MHYEIEVFENGERSLRDLRANEAMHSSIGPFQEAQQIYVQQGQVQDRLMQSGSEPLVIFDLGLGIGANALATVEVFLQNPCNRDLILISFENDLEGIQLALQQRGAFPFLERNQQRVSALLEHRQWNEGQLTWKLYEGDYRDSISEVAQTYSPELIYYDLYSPKACPDLWNYEAFRLVYQVTQQKSLLLTYTSSTAARSAMMLAGFHVGEGISTAAKRKTTVAAHSRGLLKDPLKAEWLNHLKRSSRPFPKDYSSEEAFQVIQERISFLF